MRWGVVLALTFAVFGTAWGQTSPAPSAAPPAPASSAAPPAPAPSAAPPAPSAVPPVPTAALSAPAPALPPPPPATTPPFAPPPPYAVPPYAPPGYFPPGYFPPGYFPPPDDRLRYPMQQVDTGEEGDVSPGLAIVAASLSTFVPVAVGIGMMGAADGEGGLIATGFAFTTLGLVIGPSAGHWYAGEAGRGAATMGLRFLAFGAGGGLTFGGIAVLVDSNDTGAEVAGFTMVGLASVMGAAGLGLVIWDLVDAGEAARRSNREDNEQRRGTGPQVRLGVGQLSAEWRF